MRKHFYTSKTKCEAAAKEATRQDGLARKVVEHHGLYLAIVIR